VTIPANVNATTTYPIAALTHSKEQSIAQAFVAYVLSPPGEQVLKAAGFEQP
jgi:molybdate transport system substrate-binding protein